MSTIIPVFPQKTNHKGKLIFLFYELALFQRTLFFDNFGIDKIFLFQKQNTILLYEKICFFHLIGTTNIPSNIMYAMVGCMQW